MFKAMDPPFPPTLGGGGGGVGWLGGWLGCGLGLFRVGFGWV